MLCRSLKTKYHEGPAHHRNCHHHRSKSQNNQPPAAGLYSFRGTRLEGVDKLLLVSAWSWIPQSGTGVKASLLTVVTGREGRTPPTLRAQVYLNGEMAQGWMSTILRSLVCRRPGIRWIFILIPGAKGGKMDFLPSLHVVDQRDAAAYWDFQVPLSALKHLTRLARTMQRSSERWTKPPTCDDAEALEKEHTAFRRPGSFWTGVLPRRPVEEATAVVDCIGHTHIDVAWLWTLAQTKECRPSGASPPPWP